MLLVSVKLFCLRRSFGAVLEQYSDIRITENLDKGISRGKHLAMPRMTLSVFDLIQRGEL